MESDLTDPRPAELMLPPEFILRCEIDGTTPETVIGSFIADVCTPDTTKVGRELARAYYDLVVFGVYR